MAEGPILDASTIMLVNMDDPLSVFDDIQDPDDESAAGNMDLIGDTATDDRCPFVIGAEGVPDEYARHTQIARHFFTNANNSARAAFLATTHTQEYRLFIDQATTESQGRLYGHLGPGDIPSTNQFSIDILPDNSISIFWEFGSGSNVSVLFPSTICPTGTWFSLTFRFVRGATTTVHCYLDGVEVEVAKTGNTNYSGGTSAWMSVFAHSANVGATSISLFWPGACSSFHWIEGDIGDALAASRGAAGGKFAEILGGPPTTWALHNFSAQPTQRDLAGNMVGMRRDMFTQAAVSNPRVVEGLICVDSDNDRSKFDLTGGAYMLLSNTKLARDTVQGVFTWETWVRHTEGSSAEWITFLLGGPSGSGEGRSFQFYTAFRLVGSHYRVRCLYQHGVGATIVDLVGAADALLTTDGASNHHLRTNLLTVVGRLPGGLREFDIYINKVFVETLVAGAVPATGGQLSETSRFGTLCYQDWSRLSNVARTVPEIEETYDRGVRDCIGTGGPPDTTLPLVDNFAPPPNTAISATQGIEFDVTDNSGLFCKIFLAFEFTDGSSEVVYDGDGFRPFYDDAENTVAPITNGFHFRCLRQDGWPSFPTIRAYAIDAAGNEAI